MVVLSKIHALGTKRKQFLGSLSASDGLRIVSNDKSILLIILCSCIQAIKINTSTQNLGITAILFFRNGDARPLYRRDAYGLTLFHLLFNKDWQKALQQFYKLKPPAKMSKHYPISTTNRGLDQALCLDHRHRRLLGTF
jgi:hypothetical protein